MLGESILEEEVYQFISMMKVSKFPYFSRLRPHEYELKSWLVINFIM